MCVGRLTQRVASWTGLSVGEMGVLALIPGSAVAARAGRGTNTEGGAGDHFGPDRSSGPAMSKALTSFKENRRQTQATYPLYRGTSGNQEVDYVITDASSLPAARRPGVNYAPKLRVRPRPPRCSGLATRVSRREKLTVAWDSRSRHRRETLGARPLYRGGRGRRAELRRAVDAQRSSPPEGSTRR